MKTAAKPKFDIVPDYEALSVKSLEFFLDCADSTLKEKDVFFAAISGGHTPKRFFEFLGTDPRAHALPWQKIHLFWVDERIVPPDSPQSNYRLAADTFLNKISIPAKNVHRIPTEESDFHNTVTKYEQIIRNTFQIKEKQMPQFDLIVLGMGTDGHVGSLFPNCYAPFNTENLLCVVYNLSNQLDRVTMTHPVLQAAKHIMLLVSGQQKAKILKKALESEPDDVRYPVHLLWPVQDKVTWLVDIAAAGLL